VLKLDADGRQLWQRSFGGSGEDYGSVLVLTADGGCLLAGTSDSTADAIKTSPSYGRRDFWVVRLDASGNKLWENSFGGDNSDELNCAVLTADGSFIIGGYSESEISGNKTSARLGSSDFWVIKLDANGNRVWEKTFGGTGAEILYSMVTTPDGGCLLGGYSTSDISGNKTTSATAMMTSGS